MLVDHLIRKKERKDYFDFISKIAQGFRIEIQVLGMDIGDQIEEEGVLFEGISYDPEEDVVHLFTPALEHLIENPEEIIAAEDGATVRSLFVKSKDGHFQIINFKSPLMLISGDSL